MRAMRLVRRAALRRAAAGLVVAAIALCAVSSIGLEIAPGTVSASALPAEARTTLARIRAGGPFPYSRDGVVFNNRERLLPPEPRGYYREYTVPTPRERSRGARRIVCGGAVSTLSECYYSDDHYQSFRKIQP
jgi:ribonuclease T1